MHLKTEQKWQKQNKKKKEKLTSAGCIVQSRNERFFSFFSFYFSKLKAVNIKLIFVHFAKYLICCAYKFVPGLLLELICCCCCCWFCCCCCCCWAWIWCCGVACGWACDGCMANNFVSGGLCGPTAIGGAQAIVGAGIINVDMANIFCCPLFNARLFSNGLFKAIFPNFLFRHVKYIKKKYLYISMCVDLYVYNICLYQVVGLLHRFSVSLYPFLVSSNYCLFKLLLPLRKKFCLLFYYLPDNFLPLFRFFYLLFCNYVGRDISFYNIWFSSVW